jgi:transcription initiation factor TFIID TATA-box-binding protein
MSLNNLDTDVTETELVDAGFEVVNLVSTIELNQELDLNWIATKLPSAEYQPERFPFLVYRPAQIQATSMVPTNGTVSTAGAKSKEKLVEANEKLLSELSTLGVPIRTSSEELSVQNIVISSEFDTELDLSTIAIGLGLERCEYEPEQFPGLIYRMENGTTGLIFNTGKYLVTGANTYKQAIEGANIILSELESLEIELD